MIKTILVPTSGSTTDDAVFATALSVARPCDAHLEFCHVVIEAAEALYNSPTARSARGEALKNVFQAAAEEREKRQTAASAHVQEFCARERIPMADRPTGDGAVSASWYQANGPAAPYLMARARHSDLVVMGKSRRPNGLPADFLQNLLRRCGRPILIAGSEPPRHLLSTVVVCWNESPEAARAVAAALPLLVKARKVEIVTVDDGEPGCAEAVRDIARQLAWHGIRAGAQALAAPRGGPADVLATFVNGCDADLIVMGGFRRGSVSKSLFGGCTEFMFRHAKRPVFVAN
jgi:nucleotide-binding universal stress UspA family protein